MDLTTAGEASAAVQRAVPGVASRAGAALVARGGVLAGHAWRGWEGEGEGAEAQTQMLHTIDTLTYRRRGYNSAGLILAHLEGRGMDVRTTSPV